MASGLWIEFLLAAFIIGGIVYNGVFVWRFGYLPAPFFYEPSDTFADWFNPSLWARGGGAYDAWRTVYPPLSFVLLRSVGIDRCYPALKNANDGSAGLMARDCDWIGLFMIGLIFALVIMVTWKTFRKIDRRTAFPRAVCVATGLPMLQALERGNLILVSFICLVLALGPLLRSARLRWVFAGLAVNFKVYLIIAIVPLLLKRRWLWVEGATLSIIFVYLFSLAAFGQGTPFEIYSNIRNFSDTEAGNILDGWYTSTYQSLYSLLQNGRFPFDVIIGSNWAQFLRILLPTLVYITQILILVAALAIWLRPEAVPGHRAIGLGILFGVLSVESGGYSQMFFMLFVLMEPWRGFGRRWAICCCYLLALPLDIAVDTLPETARNLYFGDTTQLISFHVTIGPFLRPFISMTVAWAICIVTIREIWLDVDRQGWADRRRFRDDFPVLPWAVKPTSYSQGQL